MSSSRVLIPRVSRRAGLAVGAGALMLATWHNPSFAPVLGFDESWVAGLHMAAAERLRFGRDIVFTYGPLGFLVFPELLFAKTAALAFAFLSLARLMLFGTLLASASRWLPFPAAALLVYVVGALPLLQSDVLLLVVFVVYTGSLLDLFDLGPWLAVLGGTAAAVELLVKVNSGAVCALIAVVTILGRAPVRRELLTGLAWFAGSFATTFAGLWVAAGGRIGDVPRWVHASYEFAAGYSALAVELPGHRWEYAVAAGLLATVAYLAVRRSTGVATRQRVAFLGIYAIFAYFYFKEGFVRHDEHSRYFFAAIAAIAIPLGNDRRSGALAAGVVATSLVVLLAVGGTGPSPSLNPIASARLWGSEARTIADAPRRRALIQRSRERMRSELSVDPRIARGLRGHSVHVDPYLADAAWAFSVHWHPLPVFSAASAYTPFLDELNASEIESPRGPQRILREFFVHGIADTSPQHETPAAFLAMVCHYRQLRAARRWQLLGRTPNRCGVARRLALVRADPDQRVAVPAADGPAELVFMRITLRRSWIDRLRAVVFKPPPAPTIAFDDGRSSRLIEATAQGPLVLRVPPSAGYSKAFGGNSNVRSFRLRGSHGPFAASFFAVHIASGDASA